MQAQTSANRTGSRDRQHIHSLQASPTCQTAISTHPASQPHQTEQPSLTLEGQQGSTTVEATQGTAQSWAWTFGDGATSSVAEDTTYIRSSWNIQHITHAQKLSGFNRRHSHHKRIQHPANPANSFRIRKRSAIRAEHNTQQWVRCSPPSNGSTAQTAGQHGRTSQEQQPQRMSGRRLPECIRSEHM